MPTRVAISPAAQPPLAHYSPAVVSDAVVYCSGVLGTDPDSGELVAGGTYEQTRRALRNLERLLDEAGSTLANVMRMTCFLSTSGSFADFERAYAELVPTPPPARATVSVQLVVPGALIEIEATAAGIEPEER